MWLSASGILVLLLYVSPTLSKEACPENVLKEAILTLAHIMRDNTQKLERHEVRERQLGDWMKKAVGALARKANGIDLLRSQLSKIDQRMTGIEQLISQRDERERIQIQKTANLIENLENRLGNQIQQINNTISEVSSNIGKERPILTAQSITSEIMAKLNETEAQFVGQIATIEFGLRTMSTKNDAEAAKRSEELKSLSTKSDEREKRQIEKTENLIKDLEKRLGAQIDEINNTISEAGNKCLEPTSPPLTVESITSEIIAKLENTEVEFVGQLAKIEFDLNTATNKSETEAKKQAQLLETLSAERDGREEKQFNKTAGLIEDLEKRLGATIEKINSTISEAGNKCLEPTSPPLTVESITSGIIAKLENTEVQFVEQLAKIEFDLNTATNESETEAKKQAQLLETLSAERDGREEKQFNKTAGLIEDLEKRLGAKIEKINSTVSEVGKKCLEPITPPLTAESITSEIIAKLNETEAHFVEQAAKIEFDLNQAMATKNEEDATALQSIFSEIRNISGIITDIEESLVKLNEAAEREDNKIASEETIDVAAMIEQQKKALNKVTELLEDTANRVQGLPTQLDVETFHNETQTSLQETKSALESAMIDKTGEIINRVGENIKGINKSVEALRSVFVNNTQQVNKELKNLVEGQGKMDVIANKVTDTKRTVEYGTHQITEDIGGAIKVNSELINKTLHDKLDVISLDIISNQSNGLATLAARMENKIDEVWRQINLMYTIMTESATALEKLQEQNQVYINDTTSTMDGMKTEVGDITARVNEVKSDLNHLLGQTSIVSQEFRNVKTQLQTMLDKMRASLKEVQEKSNGSTDVGLHDLSADYQKFGDDDNLSGTNDESSTGNANSVLVGGIAN